MLGQLRDTAQQLTTHARGRVKSIQAALSKLAHASVLQSNSTAALLVPRIHNLVRIKLDITLIFIVSPPCLQLSSSSFCNGFELIVLQRGI